MTHSDTPASSTGQANVQTTKEMLTAFEEGDLPTLRSKLAANVIWTFPGPEGVLPLTGTFVGPDAVEAWILKLAEDLEVLSFTPEEVLPAGDNVVVVFGKETVRVRQSGRSFTVAFAHRLEFANGKVIQFTEYTDTGSQMLAR